MASAILLVDQQKNTAGLAKLYLETSGFNVDHTPDPHQALKFAGQRKYGMVITDLIMHEMTGFDIYREIKPLYEEIKFLFMLSSIIEYDALKLLGSLERDDIIKKQPLSINELIFKVRAAFQASA